jgi:MiaB/RimO family radical SAM methylthiotransferase
MTKTVYIEGDGCNRRLLEVEKIKAYLEQNGYCLVNNPKTADYIVLSTCAFKKKEEDQSVSKIRDFRKYDGEMLIYGCLPDIAPQRYKEFEKINHLAPKDLENIDQFFEGIQIKFNTAREENVIENKFNDGIENGFNNIFNPSGMNFYLYICRGCRGKCSYCAIKRSIGSVKSQEIGSVLSTFKHGFNNGFRNFIILGDDPGCYGLDIHTTLPSLLYALMEEYTGLKSENGSHSEITNGLKFRINEIHPKFLILYQNELFDILSQREFTSILCPIQAGCNRILKLMNREHNVEDIRNTIKTIKTKNQDIQISTQIIIGFPSETEKEFLNTLEFIKEVSFNEITIFPYHDKENTAASRITGKVAQKEIDERTKYALKYFKNTGINAYTKCPV